MPFPSILKYCVYIILMQKSDPLNTSSVIILISHGILPFLEVR